MQQHTVARAISGKYPDIALSVVKPLCKLKPVAKKHSCIILHIALVGVG